MAKRPVKVVQDSDPAKSVPVEVLAQSIKDISAGIRKLRQGPLTDDCLVLLIQHAIPTSGRRFQRMPMKDIKAVLNGLSALERTYIKK